MIGVNMLGPLVAGLACWVLARHRGLETLMRSKIDPLLERLVERMHGR